MISFLIFLAAIWLVSSVGVFWIFRREMRSTRS
jgi:cbb3-type cytochrome oxidase subunit 3